MLNEIDKEILDRNVVEYATFNSEIELYYANDVAKTQERSTKKTI